MHRKCVNLKQLSFYCRLIFSPKILFYFLKGVCREVVWTGGVGGILENPLSYGKLTPVFIFYGASHFFTIRFQSVKINIIKKLIYRWMPTSTINNMTCFDFIIIQITRINAEFSSIEYPSKFQTCWQSWSCKIFSGQTPANIQCWATAASLQHFYVCKLFWD